MDGKMLARLGALVFVGVAITATAIEALRGDETVPPAAAPVAERGPTEPLRMILRRCRDMGEVAVRDHVCLHAWAENRDRFLKQDRAQASESNAPDTMTIEDPIRKESMVTDAPLPPEAR
ncbi:hypothetical protein NS226_08285 [Aureimonas ureilytica]|uniref:Conjugal transfer protein TrbK n=1 Tax=Aureimonas ureilytica TaxID=401562 RepID=A0A175R9W1_9HYPH|nr:putative entry exclusion protein TrbK-alt [Aureimonas ureilytica]KTQ96354.1 hypothetical protein NS226_08285 [Aureimonas ureilytica]